MKGILLFLVAIFLHLGKASSREEEILFEWYQGLGSKGDLQWDSNQSLCGQDGVICSEQGDILQLILADHGISGTLATEFGEISSLSTMDFGLNALYGSIPIEIGLISNLTTLILTQNQLTGSLPFELGNLSSLRLLYADQNLLEGSVPSSFTQLTDLQVLFLSSNFFDCSHSNFSSLAAVNDHSLWEIQCSFSCQAERAASSEWPETQDLTAIGQCLSAFEGNPSRRCLREAASRKWDSEVIDPCLAIPGLSQIKTHKTLAMAPFVAYLLLYILPLISLLWFDPHSALISIPHALFSICTLAANAWYFYDIRDTMAFPVPLASGLVLFLHLLFNLVFTLYLLFEKPPMYLQDCAVAALALILGIFDLRLCRLFGFPWLEQVEENRKKELVSSLKSCPIFFVSLPLMIIQARFFPLYAPISSLLAFTLNAQALVGFIVGEILFFTLKPKHQAAGDDVAPLLRSINGELGQYSSDIGSEDEFTSSLPASPMTYSAAFAHPRLPLPRGAEDDRERVREMRSELTRHLSWFVFPLLCLSFLPHFLSGFGAPLAIRGLKRFWVAQKKDPTRHPRWLPSRASRRASYLLPLNFLLLGTLVLPLFPLLALLALPFIPHLLADGFFWRKGIFHRSMRQLVSCILCCHLPFLRQLPDLDPPSSSSSSSFSSSSSSSPPRTSSLVAAISWVLVAQVALPAASVITSLLYTRELHLQAQEDGQLSGQEELEDWVLVALVSSCTAGAFFLLSLTRLSWGLFAARDRKERAAFLLGLSPLHPAPLPSSSSSSSAPAPPSALPSPPSPSPSSSSYFPTFTSALASSPSTRLGGGPKASKKPLRARALLSSLRQVVVEDGALGVLLGELPMLVVLCRTLHFSGWLGSLWIPKVALSLLLLCATAARLSSLLLFGRLSGGATSLTFISFLIFAAASSLVINAHVVIPNRFCLLSRTASSPPTLRQLGLCKELPSPILVRALGAPAAVTMEVEALLPSSHLEVLENRGALALSFASLLRLPCPLELSANLGPLSVGLPGLEELQEGGLLLFRGNQGLQEVSFPRLWRLPQGSRLSFQGNEGAQGRLVLPALEHLSGELEILGEGWAGEVHLPSLSSVGAGASLTLGDNPLLTRVDLPSLSSLPGTLSLLANPLLQALTLPTLLAASGALRVAQNQGLRVVGLPHLGLTGEAQPLSLNISANQGLEEIHLPSLVGLLQPAVIDGNPSLTQLSLPRLSSALSLTISGNQALLSLDLSSLDCGKPSAFVLKDNLSLQRVDCPAPCRQYFQSVNNPNLSLLCGSP